MAATLKKKEHPTETGEYLEISCVEDLQPPQEPAAEPEEPEKQ